MAMGCSKELYVFTCPVCQTEFEAKAVFSRPRRHCSKKCFYAEYTIWKRWQEVVILERACACCETMFVPEQNPQRFCCSECEVREKSERRRKRMALDIDARENRRAQSKKHYTNNREKVLAKSRFYARKRRKLDPDYACRASLKWRLANPEHYKQQREKNKHYNTRMYHIGKTLVEKGLAKGTAKDFIRLGIAASHIAENKGVQNARRA